MDTCFAIDWARYRRRDILFRVFDLVYVPEEVLREVRSESTLSWMVSSLSEGHMVIFTPTTSEVEEARRLVEYTRSLGHVPNLDMPEAICLVAARRQGYIVLTENRAAFFVPRLIPGYQEVRVWGALEVILTAIVEGVLEPPCSSPTYYFDEYSRDTLHLFSRRKLKQAEEVVARLCRERTL